MTDEPVQNQEQEAVTQAADPAAAVAAELVEPSSEQPKTPELEQLPAASAEPVEASPSVGADAVEKASPVADPKEVFREKVKAKVREAVENQPYRGAPAFDDLFAVADAIVDAFLDSHE